jgi:preprotein translocase subunit SecA
MVASRFVRTPLNAVEKNLLKRFGNSISEKKREDFLDGIEVATALNFDIERTKREAADLAPLTPQCSLFDRVVKQGAKFETQPDADRVIGIKEGIYFTVKDGVELTPELKARFDRSFHGYSDGPFDKSQLLNFNRDISDYLESWQNRNCDDQDFLASGGLASTCESVDFDREESPGHREDHIWNELYYALHDTGLSDSVEISAHLGSKRAIKQYAAQLKERMKDESNLDKFVPEVYALVTRACQVLTETKTKFMKDGEEKEWYMELYPVQIMAALAMRATDKQPSTIAEMMTSEGKTITSTLPIILHALTGQGVDVMTHNESLAARDPEWLAPLYELFDLSTTTVGINTNKDSKERQEAYGKDIRYGTAKDFGFDYLFGNLERSRSRVGFKPGSFVFIDEFDSLIDRNSPLIINLPTSEISKFASAEEQRDYLKAAQLAREFIGVEETSSIVGRQNTLARFKADYIYDVDAEGVQIQSAGLQKIVDTFDLRNEDELFNGKGRIYSKVHNALKAEQFYDEGKRYGIWTGRQLKNRFGESQVQIPNAETTVQLIDEGTGFPMLNYSLSDGMHEALEAKEGLQVHEAHSIASSITLPTFIREFYEFIAGTTGTAANTSEETKKVFNAETVSVPRHKEDNRSCYTDRLYASNDAKLDAIAEEIASNYTVKGRVRSLVNQLRVDGRKPKKGDVQREKDLQMVKQAKTADFNRPILVGVQSEQDARYLEKRVNDLLKGTEYNLNVLTANPNDALKERQIIAKAGRKNTITIATAMAGRGADIELDDIIRNVEGPSRSLGGLYVIIGERAASLRIDDQLAGRCGRQSAVGLVSAYMSLEDKLFRDNLRDSERQYIISQIVDENTKTKLAVRVIPPEDVVDSENGFTIYVNEEELDELKKQYGEDFTFQKPTKGMYDPAEVSPDAFINDPEVMKKVSNIIERMRDKYNEDASEHRIFQAEVDKYVFDILGKHQHIWWSIAEADHETPMDSEIRAESELRSLDYIPPHLKHMLEIGAYEGGLDKFLVTYKSKSTKPTLWERIRQMSWDSQEQGCNNSSEIEALRKDNKIVKEEAALQRDKPVIYYHLLDCAYQFAEFMKTNLDSTFWETAAEARVLDYIDPEDYKEQLCPFKTPEEAARFEELRDLVDRADNWGAPLESTRKYVDRISKVYDPDVEMSEDSPDFNDVLAELLEESIVTQSIEPINLRSIVAYDSLVTPIQKMYPRACFEELFWQTGREYGFEQDVDYFMELVDDLDIDKDSMRQMYVEFSAQLDSIEQMASSPLTDDLQYDLTGEWTYVDYEADAYDNERPKKDSFENTMVKKVNEAYDRITSEIGEEDGHALIQNILLDNLEISRRLKFEAIDACKQRYANRNKKVGENFDLAEFHVELDKHIQYIDGVYSAQALSDIFAYCPQKGQVKDAILAGLD